MKVTQEKLPSSQINLEIEITPEMSKNTYEKVVKNLASSTNIPGFRKGKVPRQVLLQRLGNKQIKAAALEEIIQTSLETALKQESIESLGNYQLRTSFDELIQKYIPGEILVFSASVDVAPTVELGEYKGLNLKAEETLYDAKEVDDFIEERRSQKAALIPVENRQAQMGDVAIIDFQGILTNEEEAGKEIEGGQATNFQVELAPGKLIEGMVEGIAGMQPEETKEVAVTFPADYPKTDLAGKPAVFTITLKELKEKELPELDDDFAQEVSEFETLAELRETLEKQFREKAEKATKNSINEAIIAKLVETSSLDMPETLIQEEVTALLSQTMMQMQQYGIDLKKLFNPDNIPKMRESARPEAIENLKKTLIILEVGKRESLLPTETEIVAKMKEIEAQLSNQTIDYQRLRKMVTEDLTQEKTFDWLRAQSQIELVAKDSLTTSAKASEETPENTPQ